MFTVVAAAAHPRYKGVRKEVPEKFWRLQAKAADKLNKIMANECHFLKEDTMGYGAEYLFPRYLTVVSKHRIRTGQSEPY